MEWQSFGYPKHFIGSAECHFWLATKVGNVIVSTVGDYRPHGTKTLAENIGADRKFETMVFKARKVRCECCEWECDVSGGELDFAGYNEALEAERGHLELCKRWSRLGGN